jgi:hypothetical protein
MSFSCFDESGLELCQSCWFFRNRGRTGYQYNYTESSSYYDDLVYNNPFYDNPTNYVDVCQPIPIPQLYPVQFPVQVPTCILPALPPPVHIINNIGRNTIVCPPWGNPGAFRGITRSIGGRGIAIPPLPGIPSLPIRPTAGIRVPIRGSRSFIPTRPPIINI